MSTARQYPTGSTDRQTAPRKAAPALDLEQISFVNVGIECGQLRIEAEYPSASEPGVLRSIIVRGDGTVAYHRCPGHNTHGHCLHVDNAEAIVREYHIRTYRMRSGRALRKDDRWYGAQQDGLDAEARLEWGCIGDVIAERLAAAQRREETTP